MGGGKTLIGNTSKLIMKNKKILQKVWQYHLVNGYRFYENQVKGLGIYFLDSLYADIDSLLFFAGIHQMIQGGYLRMLAKRFPFAIYTSEGQRLSF